MAVACPAGEAVTIRFDYKTPGLTAGAILSGIALVLLAGYWLTNFIKSKKGVTYHAV